MKFIVLRIPFKSANKSTAQASTRKKHKNNTNQIKNTQQKD